MSDGSVEFHVTSRGGDEPTATFALCHERFSLDLIFGHLAGAHDIDVKVAEWPDGEPVIVDQTLQPDDFGSLNRT